MKKIIVAMVFTLFTTISLAQTITILNNGKAGGSFNARTQMYKDGLEASGYEVKYVCTKNEAKGKTGALTVAHGKGYDPKLLTALLGDNIVLVPYKNSGAMLKGILGGDVDMMVNNQGKSFKYMKTGQGTCEVSDVLPIMAATVIGKNLNVKTIRRLIVNISNNSAFTEYHTSRKLHRPSGTWMSEYLLVLELEKGYEIKK